MVASLGRPVIAGVTTRVFRRGALAGVSHRSMLVASLLCLPALGLPVAAFAADECGTGTTVVCANDPADYLGGISYTVTSPPAGPFALSFEPATVVAYAGADRALAVRATDIGLNINTTNAVISSQSDQYAAVEYTNATGDGLNDDVFIRSGDVTGVVGAVNINLVEGNLDFSSVGYTLKSGVSDTWPNQSLFVNSGIGGGETTLGLIDIKVGDVIAGSDAAGTLADPLTGDVGAVGVYTQNSSLNFDSTAGGVVARGMYANGINLQVSKNQALDGTLSLDVKTGDITVDTALGGTGLSVGVSGYYEDSSAAKIGTIDTRGGAIAITRVDPDNAAQGGYTLTGVSVDLFNANADILTGNITTEGENAYGVKVNTYFYSDEDPETADSTTLDTTAGSIKMTGDRSYGAMFLSNQQIIFPEDSDTRKNYVVKTGVIEIAGDKSIGVIAVDGHKGTIDTTGGKISVAGSDSMGLLAWAPSSDTHFDITTGDIAVDGANNNFGIVAAGVGYRYVENEWGQDNQGNPIITGQNVHEVPSASFDVLVKGNVLVTGANSGAVMALAHTGGELPTGAVDVTLAPGKTAAALDQNSFGIAAASTNGNATITIGAGAVVQGGWSADSGTVTDPYTTGDILDGRAGLSATYGGESASFGGYVPIVEYQFDQNGDPIYELDDNGDPKLDEFNYPIQATITHPPSPYALAAAGIVIYAGGEGHATLNNHGTILSLNDRAVAMGYGCASENGFGYVDSCVPGSSGELAPDIFGVGETTINNASDGVIVGYVDLYDGAAHVFNNDGKFVTRNFADTDGDGVRDTVAVSRSDFGAIDDVGAGTFNNRGTVSVAGGTAPTIDPTYYYQPHTGTGAGRELDASFYDMARGVYQTQFLNLKTFNNSGVIDLRGDTVGNTFVITGGEDPASGTGGGVFVANGGTLKVNAVLNEGLAPGGVTGSQADMLIVDATQLGTGATMIEVTNKGGVGAYTPGNGIELVEVLDKTRSAANVFALKGDYTVDGEQALMAGNYAYRLYHNGVGDDGTDGNWYLRSQAAKDNPDGPDNPGEPGNPSEPGNPTNPPGPEYQPAVSIFEAYPAALMGLIEMYTLQERVGNRYWSLDGKQKERDGEYLADGIWGRFVGARTRLQPGRSTTGYRLRNNTIRLQIGVDEMLRETDDSVLIGGIYLQYADASASVKSQFGRGSIKAEGYGLGATLTYYEEDGFYLDAHGQVLWTDADLRSSRLGRIAKGNDGLGYSLSAELGERMELDDDLSMTPQTQLTYSNVSFDNFTQKFNGRDIADVRIGADESLRWRVGTTLDHESRRLNDSGKENKTHVYGIANLYYEFMNKRGVWSSGEKIDASVDRLWGGLGLGATHSWDNDAFSIYGEAQAESSLKHFGDSYRLMANVGFRVRW